MDTISRNILWSIGLRCLAILSSRTDYALVLQYSKDSA
jgi:hypothetical protein